MTADHPHSGNDTYDPIDDALYQLAERRGKWLGDPHAALTLLASLIDPAERMLPEHVLEARDDDATWHHIAAALATSPEQAELLYSPRLARHRQQVALRLLNQPKTTQRNQPPSPGGQISPVGKGSIFKRRVTAG